MISIHETPNYDVPPSKDIDRGKWREEELANMRKNTKDLLFQLSRPGMDHYRHRVSSQKGVRSDLLTSIHWGPLPTARTTIMESSLPVDASSNLFFYLFEDYSAATSILSMSNDVLVKLVCLCRPLHVTLRISRADSISTDRGRTAYYSKTHPLYVSEIR